MRAVLLAAGVGKRLKPYTDERPKCLVEISGRSLLHRHLDTLSLFDALEGIDIVVGYRHDQIRDAVAIWKDTTKSAFPVRFHMNERFTEGSILSLYAARDTIRQTDAVIMDADVLYPREVMRRLIESDSKNAFLIDEVAEESGEEMMVCCLEGRAMHIARSHDPSTHTGWDHKGEGVGFFRLDHQEAGELLTIIEEEIANGNATAEYEVALARFMKEHVCGYEQIGDLPWTEIDFSEDIVKAEADILPAIEAFEAAQ